MSLFPQVLVEHRGHLVRQVQPVPLDRQGRKATPVQVSQYKALCQESVLRCLRRLLPVTCGSLVRRFLLRLLPEKGEAQPRPVTASCGAAPSGATSVRSRDLQDRLGPPEHKALPVPPGPRGHRAFRVPRDRREPPGLPAPLVFKVLPVSRASRDLSVRKESLAPVGSGRR